MTEFQKYYTIMNKKIMIYFEKTNYFITLKLLKTINYFRAKINFSKLFVNMKNTLLMIIININFQYVKTDI